MLKPIVILVVLIGLVSPVLGQEAETEEPPGAQAPTTSSEGKKGPRCGFQKSKNILPRGQQRGENHKETKFKSLAGTFTQYIAVAFVRDDDNQYYLKGAYNKSYGAMGATLDPSTELTLTFDDEEVMTLHPVGESNARM